MSAILLSKDRYSAENVSHSLCKFADLSPETQGHTGPPLNARSASSLAEV